MHMDVLRSIAGIEIFPVISLVVFVSFFGGMLVWTLRLDRKRLRELSQLPLDQKRSDQ